MNDEPSEPLKEMSTHEAEGVEQLESEIQKEIAKLQFYLEETDELLQSKDYDEMTIVEARTTKISEKLSELITHKQEMKIEHQNTSRNEI